jgi:hypothetical protein
MAESYQREYNLLQRTFEMITHAPDMELRPIRIDLENVESNLKIGISFGVNEHAAKVIAVA